MEKPILDFFVAIGNNMDDELEEYKLFNIVTDPKVKNGRVILGLRAVDVNVHRSGALAFLNRVLGRPNIIGRLDLDKRRDCAVNELNFFPIKDGKPSVWFAFPDNYEQLPSSIKFNPYWGTAFKLVYLQMASKELQEQQYREMGYQTAEIQDMLSQSQSKLNEFIVKTVSEMNELNERRIKEQVPEKKPDEGQGGKYY